MEPRPKAYFFSFIAPEIRDQVLLVFRPISMELQSSHSVRK
jgi:hypothetical protein